MDSDTGTQIILLVFFLFSSIIFSAAETALTSLNKIRLRNMVEEGVKGASRIEEIMKDQKKLLTTILIGNNIANIGASSLTTTIVIALDGSSKTVAFATGLLTFLVLIFGEITPKTLATQNAEEVSLALAPIIQFCMTIFTPFVFVLNIITDVIIRILGGDSNANAPLITESELKTIVNVSHEEGVLEVDEKAMIHNVFDFGDYVAKEVMTPRTDVVAVNVDIDYEGLLNIFKTERFSRMPVYEESIDHILGVVFLKDIIFIENGENFQIKNYVRDVFFTYESKPIKELFAQMKTERKGLAIVLDEYGGTAGIVSLEDLVEEIVGDILDEDDDNNSEIEKIGSNMYLVDGIMRLEDLSEILGVTLDSEDFESIGGYVMGIADCIPDENDVFETEDLIFKVEKLDKNRIEKVLITKKNKKFM